MGFLSALLTNPRRRSELGLLFVGSIAVFFALVLVSLSKSNTLPHRSLLFATGLILAALFMQVVNRRYVPDADGVLMPVVLVLNGIGYVIISRVNPTYAGQQIAWTTLGLLLYGFVIATVRRVSDLERFRYILLFFAMGLLISPLLPVIGYRVNGARLWVHFHTLEFQPVEIAKILLVIFFASYFIEKRELLTLPTRRVGNRLFPDMRAFLPIAVAGALALMIILGEHDVGFSLILFVVFLTMLWVATGRWTYLAIGLGLFALATLLASHLLVQVNDRIVVWLDPWKYPSTGGFQPIQGLLAFGRGGVGGSGLGLGNPTAVPFSYSDFVFAAIGEELGLAGAAAVVAAYMIIVATGIRSALRARGEFAKLCAFGLIATFGFQAFFIMAGVVRLLPLTGVTLPFVAYGGSSLVANYALVALIMRISDESNRTADYAGMPVWSITEGEAVIGTGGR
ncbi:MAG TPA: FtsW/RodA/SpoVE family cell cycle protein [Acidimicrobiales bacterium]|nr:FtsW/RodA/SpoVE family cell cycle protein [Acidimicrobiales bacterium]